MLRSINIGNSKTDFIVNSGFFVMFFIIFVTKVQITDKMPKLKYEVKKIYN
jgi:hypothetical protein